jgi:hypothetical protein
MWMFRHANAAVVSGCQLWCDWFLMCTITLRGMWPGNVCARQPASAGAHSFGPRYVHCVLKASAVTLGGMWNVRISNVCTWPGACVDISRRIHLARVAYVPLCPEAAVDASASGSRRGRTLTECFSWIHGCKGRCRQLSTCTHSLQISKSARLKIQRLQKLCTLCAMLQCATVCITCTD